MARETKKQIRLLQKCLERAELERLEPGEFARAHPEAGEVFGELEAAAWLKAERRRLEPGPAFTKQTRSRLFAQIDAVRRPKVLLFLRAWGGMLRTRAAGTIALLLVAAALILNCTVLANASSVSIPGDAIYPVKLGIESLRLAVSFSPVSDAGLHLDFAQQRLTEIQYLALEGRYENIPAASRNFKQHLNSGLVLFEMVCAGQGEQVDVLGERFQALEEESHKAVFALTGIVPAATGTEITTVIEVSALHRQIAAGILGQ